MSRRKRAKSNTSRAIAIVAVYVLVSVALLGMVVALRGKSKAASPTTQQEAVEMTPAAPTAAPSGPGTALPVPAALPSMSGVQFAESSDDLPGGADSRLARVSATAKAQRKAVYISALVTTGAHNEESLALARKRLAVVRRALLANGLTLDDVRLQISPVAPSAATPTRLALVDLMIR
jgi:hypothetical protein